MNNLQNSYKIILQSDNINFIELNPDLINDYLEMVNDVSIQKSISTKRKIYTYEDEMNWVKRKLEEKALVFSMIEKSTNRFIGNFEFMDVTDTSAEIGIVIRPQYQNKGYGMEALKTMIDYAFSRLKLQEIILVVFSNNKRAIHCYKKLGFKEYKVDENVCVIDTESVDDIYMILKR